MISNLVRNTLSIHFFLSYCYQLPLKYPNLENIMLENEKDLSTIKLIDFGLSVKYDDTSFNNMLNDR